MSGLDAELQVGDLFAGHRITGIAGRGGMGVVYRAEQLDLQRPVALKLIAEPLARDEAFRERFVRESRAAAAIDHPNVIPVYGAGEEDGRLYLSMRLVNGDDLRTLVHHAGPLSPPRAGALIMQVAGALDAAHARGLVHRDIKPANVLLDGDHAYLTDFGLTKRLAGGEETMTGAGRWVGTLGYIAPEQIRGEAVDARADVYALGCLLFFVLTGVAPYRRDSDEATLYAHLTAPAPDPRELEPIVPEGLADVVRRALEKDPADRFPSAGDLGRAALAAVGDAPAPPPERVVARGAAAPGGADEDETAIPASVTPTEIAPKRQRTRPRWRTALAPLLSLLAGAAVVVAVVLVLRGGDDEQGGDGAAATATTTAAPPAAAADATGLTAKAAAPVKVDSRPNAITYAEGRVWVASGSTGRLIGLPADGRGRRKILSLGWTSGTSSVDAGFGSLWVTNSATHELVRLDPSSGKIQARIPIEPGALVKVAAGEGSVWVGRRQENDAQAISSLVKIDPDTNQVTDANVLLGEEGVGDVATGGGFVWVPNRRRDRLTRITPADGHRESVRVGIGPHYAAFGGGYAWVTNAGEGSVSQVARDFDPNVETLVGAAPTGVAVGGGAVWIANRLGDTVARVNVRTGTLIGQPVAVGRNPYAIVARGASAWVTSLGDSTVTRIDISG